jgi:hypothetical protein
MLLSSSNSKISAFSTLAFKLNSALSAFAWSSRSEELALSVVNSVASA